MFSRICVIGLGTLGGFLAKNISELKTTTELLLIDYDTVEQENMKNSIYLKRDIGKLKTEAIKDKINSDAKIVTINKKFIEGKTKIDNYDLIIDCRDFTYERKDLIDVRLSISYRQLIIDCRKNVKYEKQYEGAYIEKLSKLEIKSAALHTSLLIENGIFNEFLKRKIVLNIPIDSISENIRNVLTKKTQDVIYDVNECDKKLINLHNNYPAIIDANKKSDLTVCVGSQSNPFIKKIIPQNNFQSINDITSEFSGMIKNLPYPYNYFIITVNKYFIEILPEIGSA